MARRSGQGPGEMEKTPRSQSKRSPFRQVERKTDKHVATNIQVSSLSTHSASQASISFSLLPTFWLEMEFASDSPARVDSAGRKRRPKGSSRSCPHCQRTFARMEHLDRHIRTRM